MRVAVLGASPNPQRYSNKAVSQLLKHRHEVFPVHPQSMQIHGISTFSSLDMVPKPIDIITMYVGPERGEALAHDIILARPRIIVFNPGSESPALQRALGAAAIPYTEACTLVMLSTGQFDKLV
ncbi:MAG: CoA-binding protein [Oligoflexales bacterium]